MRRKSGGTLFVCLNVAHLTTVRTFPLRSLLLFSRKGNRAGGRPGRASTTSLGGRGGGDALGFLASEASFTITFKARELQGNSRGK
jgi:hypothetical protein